MIKKYWQIVRFCEDNFPAVIQKIQAPLITKELQEKSTFHLKLLSLYFVK